MSANVDIQSKTLVILDYKLHTKHLSSRHHRDINIHYCLSLLRVLLDPGCSKFMTLERNSLFSRLFRVQILGSVVLPSIHSPTVQCAWSGR